MGVSAHQVLDELVKELHIVVQVCLDFQHLLVQAVVAIAPVTAADLLDGKTQIFLRENLLVNSNSFHQGYVFLLVASQLFHRRGVFRGETRPEVY